MSKPSRKPPSLAALDLSPSLASDEYERRLETLQHRLALLQQAHLLSGAKGVIVFEGWDAAGKGGAIRRISAAMDPRSFKVWPIGAPRPYYLQRHFLLRFMERLPPSGAISAFDRSWYGRVLVERVEGLTPKPRWKATYREITEFERMLTDDGIRLAKIFFHISPEEQLARLEARLRDPMKRWKLSYEDFRNRAHWDDNIAAAEEMFARTHSRHAPWALIAANDKKHARIAAIEHVLERLGEGLDLGPPALSEEVIAEALRHFELEPELLRSLRGRTD